MRAVLFVVVVAYALFSLYPRLETLHRIHQRQARTEAARLVMQQIQQRMNNAAANAWGVGARPVYGIR